MQPDKRRLLIDGKPVRCWLFARYTRVMLDAKALIPVDSQERRAVLNQSDSRRFLALAQVEGFTLDHAWQRLTQECFPQIARADWEMLEELDPEHDVGKLGSKHPLLPSVFTAPTSTRIQ